MKLRRETRIADPRDRWDVPRPYTPPPSWGEGFAVGLFLGAVATAAVLALGWWL